MGGWTDIRDGIGLVFQVTAIFDSGGDVEVDGAVFEYFDHFSGCSDCVCFGMEELSVCLCVWDRISRCGVGGLFTYYPSRPSFRAKCMTSSFRLEGA